MTNDTLYSLCKAFDARQSALGMKKGKKRDDACIEFFVGAANALKLASHDDAKRIELFLALDLVYRGFATCLRYVSTQDAKS